MLKCLIKKKEVEQSRARDRHAKTSASINEKKNETGQKRKEKIPIKPFWILYVCYRGEAQNGRLR